MSRCCHLPALIPNSSRHWTSLPIPSSIQIRCPPLLSNLLSSVLCARFPSWEFLSITIKESLQFIDNVSPCVVWIDEIEKSLSVSDSGNDIGKRVLGQFLFWLQESRSRVFLVATANDVSLLPFELFRKGRFSEIYFFNHIGIILGDRNNILKTLK